MVNTVVKAMRILDILAEKPKLTLSQITRTLDLPKSSVHGILQSLCMDKLVERDESSGQYQLGVKLIELGNRARIEMDICKIAAPFLQGLNMKYDETVHLTILDHDEVLYLDCIESKHRLRTYSVIGIRAPLYCTSVGKAILAFQKDDEIRRIVREKGLARITPTTLDSEEKLWAEIARIRESGYAIDDMEHEEFLRCVGAPIRNAKGEVFASLSLSGPTERNTRERIASIAPSVTEAGAEISRRLGYRP
jgi:DNA-binding IclR family transcriptional regulator